MAFQCFHVLIHGQFDERIELAPKVPTRGFYTSRWVVSNRAEGAAQKAFRSAELERREWPDIRDGLVGVSMEAAEIEPGSWWRRLRGGGRGFTFYGEE